MYTLGFFSNLRHHWVLSWVEFKLTTFWFWGQTSKPSCLGAWQEDSCLAKPLISWVRWLVSITQAPRMTDAQASFICFQIWYTTEFCPRCDSNSQPSDLWANTKAILPRSANLVTWISILCNMLSCFIFAINSPTCISFGERVCLVHGLHVCGLCKRTVCWGVQLCSSCVPWANSPYFHRSLLLCTKKE